MSEDKKGWLWISTFRSRIRVSNQKLSSGVLSSTEVCEVWGCDGLPNPNKEKQIGGADGGKDLVFHDSWPWLLTRLTSRKFCSSTASRRGHYGG